MYISNKEIRYLRDNHPQLLNQASYYMTATPDNRGYELSEIGPPRILLSHILKVLSKKPMKGGC